MLILGEAGKQECQIVTGSHSHTGSGLEQAVQARIQSGPVFITRYKIIPISRGETITVL